MDAKDERHWLTSASVGSLFYATERLPNRRTVRTARRIRLFCCGCYRLVWHRIKLASIKEAVEKTEDWADGLISREELERHRYPQGEPRRRSPDWGLQLSIAALITPKVVPDHVADLVRAAVEPGKYESAGKWADCPPQADLVREVFGNPYRPAAFEPKWRTETAVHLARRMYEARDFSAMPILADALQDAGCDNETVLAHCRGPGPHVRGCWVVDLVLGKS